MVDGPGVGKHSAVALDSAGRPHVSYYDHTDDDLKYAHKGTSVWTIETVDYAGPVGAYTSLALDSADHPHISYCSCTDQSCTSCNDLKYAWHDGTTWHIDWADTEGNVGGYTSLALDEEGGTAQPHIAYYDFTKGDLKYAYKDASGLPHWQTVDGARADVGMFASLAIDGDHRYISYFDNSNKHLKYAHHDGSTWHVETLDSSGDVGYYSSLALCTTHVPAAPRIFYWADGELKYAHKFFFGGWSFATIANDPPAGISAALDSVCHPHISYFEQYNGDLKYTYQDVSGWHIETVDDEGDVWPYWSSLALDASSRPHISYYDDSHVGLSYAYQAHTVYLPRALRNVE
jgi:hypothetical protein